MKRTRNKYSDINQEFRDVLQKYKTERKERTIKIKNARKAKRFWSFA